MTTWPCFAKKNFKRPYFTNWWSKGSKVTKKSFYYLNFTYLL